jgi:hypothetical protein
MMNWPQFLVRADDWATGFLTGTAVTSVIVFAGAAVLLLTAFERGAGPFAGGVVSVALWPR